MAIAVTSVSEIATEIRIVGLDSMYRSEKGHQTFPDRPYAQTSGKHSIYFA